MLKFPRDALALLAVALVLGAAVRFYGLNASGLTADEGASWAAATEPSLRLVIETEQRLDPGKLALYDVLLHGWISIFGDGLVAMRSMSAALGTVAIVLVFVTVREVILSLSRGSPDDSELAAMAGAFAALLYATNLQMVQTDRAARMYALMMAAELMQIFFFVRAQRRGRMVNYAGVAVFTAAMVAANFTASFLLVAEALWLGCLLVGRLAGAQAGGLAIFRPGFAVLAGLALLGPMIPGAIASSAAAIRYGAINWLKLQPISWPYTTLRGVAGKHSLFWMMLALGAFGLWWNWRKLRLPAGFVAAWMLGPLAGVMAASYLLRPVEYPRYVIIVAVALFAFTALGAAAPRSSVARVCLAAFLIYVSLQPLFQNWRNVPDQAAWDEAAALAERQTEPAARIAVFPAFADSVVRYYLPIARRSDVEGVQDDCGRAQVLVMSGFDLYAPARVVKIESCYPHRIASLYKVEVRAR